MKPFWLIISGLITLIATFYITEIHVPKLYQKRFKYVFSSYIKAIFVILFLSSIFGIFILGPNDSFWKYMMIEMFAALGMIGTYAIVLFISLRSRDPLNYTKTEITKYTQSRLCDEIPERTEFEKAYLLGSLSSPWSEGIVKNLPKMLPSINGIKLAEITDASKLNNKPSLVITSELLNDYNDLNETMLNVHSIMANGGTLVCVYQELRDFEESFFKSGFGVLRNFKKLVYLIYYRAMPKIPILNRFYKFFSNGKNRVYSKAEVWGRLAYCGFDVKKDITIDGLHYISARKEFEVSDNPSPSFYPVIALNRIGLYGQIIKIHKVRSMFPYSEFIQKKIHDESQLTSTGKFVNDFRITEFGNIFRKYWIDELPQLFDWFRGEIKLVGIRALSQHYFSLYPPEFQEKFISVKPGIISPIFDEETDGFDDIVKIETAYLDSYLKNPVLTDIKYFFITFKQILSGVRSK